LKKSVSKCAKDLEIMSKNTQKIDLKTVAFIFIMEKEKISTFAP